MWVNVMHEWMQWWVARTRISHGWMFDDNMPEHMSNDLRQAILGERTEYGSVMRWNG